MVTPLEFNSRDKQIDKGQYSGSPLEFNTLLAKTVLASSFTGEITSLSINTFATSGASITGNIARLDARIYYAVSGLSEIYEDVSLILWKSSETSTAKGSGTIIYPINRRFINKSVTVSIELLADSTTLSNISGAVNLGVA